MRFGAPFKRLIEKNGSLVCQDDCLYYGSFNHQCKFTHMNWCYVCKIVKSLCKIVKNYPKMEIMVVFFIWQL